MIVLFADSIAEVAHLMFCGSKSWPGRRRAEGNS